MSNSHKIAKYCLITGLALSLAVGIYKMSQDDKIDDQIAKFKLEINYDAKGVMVFE